MHRRNSTQSRAFEKRTHSRVVLAEIIGIMLGDGGIYLDYKHKYQLTISFNKKEIQYRDYVKNLFEDYFFPYTFRVDELASEFLIRNVSFHLVDYLISEGLISGDKNKNRISIPKWVFQDKKYLIPCIRGLFDTDGSIYRKYGNYSQIQFKFGHFEIVDSIRKGLVILDFKPTKITSELNNGFTHWKVYLSRQDEIKRFFNIFNPANKKHLSRYKKIKMWGDRDLNPDLTVSSDHLANHCFLSSSLQSTGAVNSDPG